MGGFETIARAVLLGVAGMATLAATPGLAQGQSAGRASEIETPGPLGPLRGTLLVPPGRPQYPVILMLPGSGPTDRDGDNGGVVKGAVYRQLAEGLAVRGIATVRIDKRGLFGSTGAVADPNAVTIGDYADDTAQWVKTIRRQTGAKCIWLMGHSEGGLIALKAAQVPPKQSGICGVVLVSAPGRRLSDVIREQLKANPANAPVLPQAMAALESLDAGKAVDVSGIHPGLRAMFNPGVQPYLIDLFSYDPAVLAGRYAGPMLIVQGARDIQVSTADARRLSAAQPKAVLAIIPAVNHVFKTVASDDRAANIATYGNAALPIDERVTGAIADFVIAKAAR